MEGFDIYTNYSNANLTSLTKHNCVPILNFEANDLYWKFLQ